MFKQFGSKQLLPLLAFGLGALYAGLGLGKYGFWDDVNGPRPGFFPIIAGCVMMLAALLTFFQSFSEKKPHYHLEDFAIIVAVAIALAASYLIGLVPAALLMVFLWLKFYEKESWKNCVLVTAVLSAIVLGVFVYWLEVPFPLGEIGELLY